MSKATFDPNNIRVEDLFRAKEERRQRLARLPFEEKIKIVEKLQRSVAAAMKNEKLIFDSFLKACPAFAGEPISEWDLKNITLNVRLSLPNLRLTDVQISSLSPLLERG